MMGIEANSRAFRRAVEMAAKVVDRSAKIPILSTVRCRANGKLEVTGTDLDMTLSVSVERVPGKDMEFALMSPMEVVKSIAAAGGDGLKIELVDRKANFATGGLTMDVGTLHADDFPMIAVQDLDPTFTATLSAAHIRSIMRVANAISTEETRYYLNGLCVRRMESGMFRAEATDGHRLHFIEMVWPDASGEFAEFIIPRKAVRIMSELASKAAGDVKLVIGTVPPVNRDESLAPARGGAPKLSLSFEIGRDAIEMKTKLIDGTFPDTGRVVPKSNERTMLFNSGELRSALMAVSGKSKDTRAVKIILSEGAATLSAKYAALDIDASVTVPCQHDGNGFEIGFNGRYLIEMIESGQGDEISFICGADASGPALVKNPADTEWTGVLMPMRV